MAILAQCFCGNDEGYLFIAGARGGDPLITRFPLKPVYAETVDYLKGIVETGESEAGDALRSLVEQIVEHSTADEVVWIVPHSILHYLPFHALPTRKRVPWASATLFVTRPALRPCLFVAEVRDLMARP